jgi:hypothetical protein
METTRQGFHLVRRRKGIVCHYGVLLATPEGPTTVFQLVPAGYETVDYAEFAKGRRVAFLDWRPLAEGPAIRERLEALPGRHPRWSLFGHNCEHAARWVLTGRRESRQVAACAAAAAFAASVLLRVARR